MIEKCLKQSVNKSSWTLSRSSLGGNYNCKSPVHIFNCTIQACESGLEVKSKKENIIIISLAKTEYLKVHLHLNTGIFQRCSK